MPLSSNQFTNLNLTQIAAKRLSGKAQTNSNFSIANEGYGSTVQTLAQTVFAEIVPNNPNPTWATHNFIIQSSSEGSPGTVQLVEFELEAFGTPYVNSTDNDAGDSSDQGASGGVSTYHSYAIKLTGSYEGEANNNLNTDASTESTLGTGVFQNGYFMSGSGGRLQIVPEYASSLVSTGNPTTGNPYTPYLIAANGNQITIGSDIDWYLDTYSGILFVQDPVDFTSGLASSRPNKIRCFIYTGKYQDQATFTASDVNFIVSGSDEGFAVGNDDTINFVSGSAGITVVNDGTDTITIGAETDNITVNQITASIINADKIEATEYIVSSSVTYTTQSFSSGSTIFGDTNDDTHKFTGSIDIIHTGSDYGITITGSGLTINSGDGASISASGFISASDLYLTDTLTALDGGVTVTANSSVELEVDGNITASGDISASGLFFASASDADGGANIEVAMYDTVTGQFYYTGSEALGDTTLLEASASAGIFFSASGGGTSIALTETASFEGDSATGITVTHTAGTITVAADPDTLVAATSDTSNFEFTSSVAISASIAQTASYVTTAQTASYVENAQTASYVETAQTASYVESALSSSTITVTDNENTDGALPIVFHDGTAGNSVNLQSDASAFTYNPNNSTYGPILTVGDNTNRIQLGTSSLHTTTDTGFDLLNTTVTTINIGGDATTISMGASTGTVTINGSASIAGDLIVQGAVTSIQTDNLNVEDQFILLNSGAASATDTGIIVQTSTTQNQGSALYWDTTNSRWEIDYDGADASSNTAAGDAAIVAVRTNNSATPLNPYMGAVDAGIGQMYIDTGDNDGDGNTIYIYA